MPFAAIRDRLRKLQLDIEYLRVVANDTYKTVEAIAMKLKDSKDMGNPESTTRTYFDYMQTTKPYHGKSILETRVDDLAKRVHALEAQLKQEREEPKRTYLSTPVLRDLVFSSRKTIALDTGLKGALLELIERREREAEV